MPVIVDKLDAIFGLVVRVADMIAAFVWLGVFHPSSLSLNSRGKIVSKPGEDRFPVICGEILMERVSAGHSPIGDWGGGICALSAEWSAAAAEYS
jgi:hypothetical protein